METETSKRCYQVNLLDNVAVLLEDAGAEPVTIIGSAAAHAIVLHEPVQIGHKVALVFIRSGDPVLKFGVRIGHATQDIRPGDWVHLHNCASDYDARSATLDLKTGGTTDTKYE